MTAGETIISDRTRKIAALPGGVYVAISGSVSMLQSWLDWLTGAGAKPAIDDDTVVIVAGPGRLEEYDNTGCLLHDPATPQAWGAGFREAMGALRMGATAIEAVEAAKVNVFTGGEVMAVRIDMG